MSEKNNVISPELWAPLEQEEKNAEKMERPSLTFLQDGWRRLKSNSDPFFDRNCFDYNRSYFYPNVLEI